MTNLTEGELNFAHTEGLFTDEEYISRLQELEDQKEELRT
jgi:hypothetical protein